MGINLATTYQADDFLCLKCCEDGEHSTNLKGPNHLGDVAADGWGDGQLKKGNSHSNPYEPLSSGKCYDDCGTRNSEPYQCSQGAIPNMASVC